ncbi:MAG TPA: hypothetical protein PLS49_05085 [Candidatus Woesebacteria bacterium]|nr:hypothetical protein [Candidatus Woesebacteria bacterium]
MSEKEMPSIQRQEGVFTNNSDSWINPTDLWQNHNIIPLHEKGPGCHFNCLYCNQSFVGRDESEVRQSGYILAQTQAGVSLNTRIGIEKQIVSEIDPNTLLNEFFQWPYYNENMSIIFENFTDPSVNWKRTLYLMEQITQHGHTGPLIFITKGLIPNSYTKKMADLKEQGGHPVGIVTYTGLPQEIEPASSADRLTTMSRLTASEIPVLLSMQPMIKGINDSEEMITQILTETKGITNGIFVSGLYVDPHIVSLFAEAGFPLDTTYTDDIYSIAKKTPQDVISKVKTIANQLGITLPIHETANCAIASVMTTLYNKPTTNRTADWRGSHDLLFDSSLCSTCDPVQKEICQSTVHKESTEQIVKVNECLQQFGYTAENGFQLTVMPSNTHPGLLLIEGGSLSIEELYLIEERTGCDVNNLPAYTEQGLLKRSREAIEGEMHLEFDTTFIGATLVDQEWFIILNSNSIGDKVKEAQRWLRNKNRARIHVISSNDLIQKGYEVISKEITQMVHFQNCDLDSNVISTSLKDILDSFYTK